MEKVTRQALREMAMGETRVFELPSAAACESGATTAYRAQHFLDCRFRVHSDYVNRKLTITKTR